MLVYTARRLLQIVPVFLGATFLLFSATYVIPGDPVRLMTGERAMEPARYNEIRSQLNLDKPPLTRYFLYMGSLLKGDLGVSYQKKRPVADILMEGFPNSLKLAVVAVAVEGLLGVVAGVAAAVKRDSFWDVLITLSTGVLLTLPVFWLGIMLQVLFGVRLGWFPVAGMDQGGPAAYVLPAVTLAAASTAYIARLMRSQMLETLEADFVRTAIAKGLSGRQVVYGHALRNAVIPAVTFIGMDLGTIIGGSVLVETIFNWPGIGNQIYHAVLLRDNPVVFGGVTLLVGVFLLINLLVDISYGFLDPRIRYGGSR
ncbi:MAG: ABC transporter permease [Candidatus Aquicultorales bacterium]